MWEVRDQLVTSYLRTVAAGVAAEKIIIDPGIGFGKTADLNRKLIGFAALTLGIPTMIGYSRKRFLGEDRLQTQVNVEAGRKAVQLGAKYLRVHDVAAHRRIFPKKEYVIS